MHMGTKAYTIASDYLLHVVPCQFALGVEREYEKGVRTCKQTAWPVNQAKLTNVGLA